jgi:hypothetical protein
MGATSVSASAAWLGGSARTTAESSEAGDTGAQTSLEVLLEGRLAPCFLRPSVRYLAPEPGLTLGASSQIAHPPASFTAGVVTLALLATIVASLAPAVAAAHRDPLAVLRTREFVTRRLQQMRSPRLPAPPAAERHDTHHTRPPAPRPEPRNRTPAWTDRATTATATRRRSTDLHSDSRRVTRCRDR